MKFSEFQKKGEIMGLMDGVKEWLFQKALAKGVKAIVAVAISYVTSIKVAAILAQGGVTIDPAKLAEGLTLVLTGVVTMALNFIKVKWGVKFL